MKLIFLLCVMLLAAMGPSRSAGPPLKPLPVPEAEPAPQAEPVAALTIYNAASITPEELVWVSRPVVVFADTPDDPAFVAQLKALNDRPDALILRDVVVITDADPAGQSVWRQKLHPRGFSLVILDKDGQVKLRKPFPWDVREISRAINKFPLRLQEIGRAGVIP